LAVVEVRNWLTAPPWPTRCLLFPDDLSPAGSHRRWRRAVVVLTLGLPARRSRGVQVFVEDPEPLAPVVRVLGTGVAACELVVGVVGAAVTDVVVVGLVTVGVVVTGAATVVVVTGAVVVGDVVVSVVVGITGVVVVLVVAVDGVDEVEVVVVELGPSVAVMVMVVVVASASRVSP
jgi:hypothetical protein